MLKTEIKIEIDEIANCISPKVKGFINLMKDRHRDQESKVMGIQAHNLPKTSKLHTSTIHTTELRILLKEMEWCKWIYSKMKRIRGRTWRSLKNPNNEREEESKKENNTIIHSLTLMQESCCLICWIEEMTAQLATSAPTQPLPAISLWIAAAITNLPSYLLCTRELDH